MSDRVSAAAAIVRALDEEGVSMREIARRMAGTNDYRRVENERTRLAKIVREDSGVYDATASRLEDALGLERGTISRYEPGTPKESQRIADLERRQEEVARAVASVTRTLRTLASELRELREQLARRDSSSG